MNKKSISPKTHGRISVILIWAGAIVTLLTNTVGRWCLWAGLAIAVAGLVYRLIVLRCPCCGNNLSGYQTIPDRCPKCGQSLD